MAQTRDRFLKHLDQNRELLFTVTRSTIEGHAQDYYERELTEQQIENIGHRLTLYLGDCLDQVEDNFIREELGLDKEE